MSADSGWTPRRGPPPGTVICDVVEIPDPGAKGFVLGTGPEWIALFIVRKNGSVFGYANDCPHARLPLDWPPGRFLTEDEKEILCGRHGARFRIEDGACLAGPCKGKSLAPVPVGIAGAHIVLTA